MYSERKSSHRRKEHGQLVSADNELGVRSVSVLIITFYCMHTDDFNKSSKIVDIIYILSYIFCS